MGYELWTSPVTGYRRKGTRLADIHRLLDAGIVTRTIYEPLFFCRPDDSASEIRHLLETRDFDVVGVRENANEPIQGYAISANLKGGLIREHVIPVQPGDLIADSTSLADLLTVLRNRAYAFVLVGFDVSGIVTRADLNKPPIRIYLFGLISLLEMHLQYWLRELYGEESWMDKLKAPRLQEAQKLHEERKRKNEDIKLIDCLQFCDKRDLLLSNKELRVKLGLGGKENAKSLLGRAEDLRNDLAHSQINLVGRFTWSEQIGVIQDVEILIQRSDEAIEQSASEKQIVGDREPTHPNVASALG